MSARYKAAEANVNRLQNELLDAQIEARDAWLEIVEGEK